MVWIAGQSGISADEAAEMPLAKLLQIVHCYVLSNGGKTRWQAAFPGDDAEIDALVETLKKQKKDLKRLKTASPRPFKKHGN